MIKIGNTSSQVQKLKRGLNVKDDSLNKNILKALHGFSLDFSRKAKKYASNKRFRLTSAIQPLLPKKQLIGGAEVTKNAFYAPYVEFGTRSLTDVPREFEDIARQYKGKSTFQSAVSFKDSLINWLKTKHNKTQAEAERIYFPIMMKILKVGTKPQPFMYPAFKEALPTLRRLMKQGIKNTTR